MDDKSSIAKPKRTEINKIGDKLMLGHSQFNEILLLLGFDRVYPGFFQYLVDGTIDYKDGSAIESLQALEKGVERFRTLALLWFGNIKFAFKALSKDPYELELKVTDTRPWKKSYYISRHPPISDIDNIPAEKTYFLGYLIADKLKERIRKDKNDLEARTLYKEMGEYLKIGKKNQLAYLSSDHLDVYVATSMRLEHEYIFVSRFVANVFSKPILSELKIRWFDPTQAYCDDRIDKGLSEALMLKRAKCTLYLVQESDTFGKDSELASTLAQGKPVVAYVPHGNKKYVDGLLSNLKKLNPKKSEIDIVLEQLEVFKPSLAWNDKKVMSWLSDRNNTNLAEAKKHLYEVVKKHYDKRADTLTETHPLGIQVNLISGVANGVLVVRNESDCAKLIHSILLNDMKFEICTKVVRREKYVYLRETISKSIFRVKTGDRLLDNSFWNFYTEPQY
ncbi:MAG: hypothetical protein JXR56_05860 [Candidatus Cloacimonetes bacterium]|nr:hypothetical protein [Candidatus Cloacimonadota bacterium]